jgi:ubiquinone/menaquinone biosynthesis C-methylase UbiE
MRAALHAHYAEAFRPGERVLDVGCGTGIDAIALARRGIRVVGIDASAGMIAQATGKVAAAGLSHSIEVRHLPIQDLQRLAGERFDGLISAFASLSSVPDLTAFAADAARLLRPAGRAILHLLNRFSSWEWLGHVRDRNWTNARRVGRLTTRHFTIGGQAVSHSMYYAGEAYRRFFAADFALRRAYGLGAIRPPHTVRRVPGQVARTLEWLDVRSGGLPLLRDLGRFFVLDLERRAT